MTLSIREMCWLSAAAGWLAAWGLAWAFQWLKRDVREMSFAELRELLKDIRKEIMARGVNPGPK